MDNFSKVCKWCNTTKTLEEFPKHFKMKDGHLNRCYDCENYYRTEYHKNNRNIFLDRRNKNIEQVNAYKRTEKYKEVRNASRRKKYKEDLNYKILCILRSRLVSALNGAVKEHKTIDYLGCSIMELRNHLERQFVVGMTWENWKHDIWHVDHIRPLSSFDLTDENQLKLACHYTNLQPLWAKDNLEKSDKWDLYKTSQLQPLCQTRLL